MKVKNSQKFQVFKSDNYFLPFPLPPAFSSFSVPALAFPSASLIPISF
jgi:hypothetical protein